jgi:hypothetical protein
MGLSVALNSAPLLVAEGLILSRCLQVGLHSSLPPPHPRPKEIAARQAPVLQPRLLGDDPIALVCGHLSLIPRLLLKLLPPELGVPLANFTIILLYQILLSTTSNLLVMLASLSLPTVHTVGRDSEKAVELEPPAIAWMGSYHRFSRGAGRSSLYGNRRVD